MNATTAITFRLNETRTLVSTDGSEVTFEYTSNIPGTRGTRGVMVTSYSATDGMSHRHYSIGTAKTIWAEMAANGATEDARFANLAA